MIAAVWMGLIACFGALMGADIAFQIRMDHKVPQDISMSGSLEYPAGSFFWIFYAVFSASGIRTDPAPQSPEK